MADDPRSALWGRRQWLAACAAAGVGGGAWPAWAQKAPARSLKVRWPVQEVELTVPFPVGGSSSMLSKALSRQFAQSTGQGLRVEYRSGGAGATGASYVAKAPADGLHLLMGSSNMVIARAVQQQLNVDLYEHFAPLALVAQVPLVMLVNQRRLPTRTLPELLAELRRKPQRYRYASSGIGGFTHMLGEWFKLQTGALMEHVPYRGAGPALQSLANDNVDVMFDSLSSAMPHLLADRTHAMLVTGEERSPLLPDVPTAKELGLQDFQFSAWYGIFAPQATPLPVQQRMSDVFAQMGEDPELQAEWGAMGARWPGRYGKDFALFIQEEMQRWASIARSTLGAGK